MLAYLDHSLLGQTNENHPFSHSMIHCFPLECVCGGGCPHPECYLQQWGTPVSAHDNAIKHLQETRIKLICPKCRSSSHARGMLRVCLHCPLFPFSSSQVTVWFVKLCGPVNTPTRVQHSLQGRCLARAGLDNVRHFYPIAAKWRAGESSWALWQ